ncbi:MAG: cytochrome c oxidase, cbb3-type, subunit [Candidatus Brocadiaceae bacterium]|nr:cytochrome c oxidase, cbb3-type, subunit [Candidatus Brocadiaceae bacterium]
MRHSITTILCGVPIFLAAWLCSSVLVSHAQEEGVNAKKLFVYHCATCHGEDGKGTKRGHELKSPNLADANWQAKKKDDEILNSITNGKNKMPRWNEKLKPEEIQALANYVRKLAPKKKS